VLCLPFHVILLNDVLRFLNECAVINTKTHHKTINVSQIRNICMPAYTDFFSLSNFRIKPHNSTLKLFLVQNKFLIFISGE
ncbi:MAG: hypothetical protein WBP74_00885, partial [Nitrososphaeraceae archaeon]